MTKQVQIMQPDGTMKIVTITVPDEPKPYISPLDDIAKLLK